MRFDGLRDKPEFLKHVLALTVSLIVHAVVLYLMAAHFVSVKIIDFKEKVTPVLIAPPPPRLEVPEAARRPAELPEVRPDFPDFIPTRTLRGKQPAEARTIAPLEEAREGARIEAFEPKFTEGFRLDKAEPGAGARDRLRLTVPERAGDTAGKIGGSPPSPPKDIDWRKYLSAGAPGTPGTNYGGAIRRRPGGRSSLRATRISPAELRKYNLSGWASQVVELIQKNWEVPQTRLEAAETVVEIVVVVEKPGAVSDVQVVGPSDDASFDRAARLAIEASSPLPALPKEFPGRSLEISFVFSKK